MDNKGLVETVASEILQAFYPDGELPQDGSELILLNMKCFRAARKAIPIIWAKLFRDLEARSYYLEADEDELESFDVNPGDRIISRQAWETLKKVKHDETTG